jgi:DNA-binding CsgD family transcriptional regulator
MATGSAAPDWRANLLGRAEERARLEELVADVQRGQSRSLVLRGDAGIGKTALLEYLVGVASHMTVLRAVGVESEVELAYAGLHQLCSPLLDRLERLPEPQRRALETVFGMSTGVAPDRFVVGLAVLGLLSEAAAERPLLCVIDDARWWDEASMLALAFVTRRLQADPVGVVFAARIRDEAVRHLPELEVRGLDEGDAHALLGLAVPFKLDADVRDRILAETRGNPLALLELPRGLSPDQLADGFGVLDARGLTGRIQESFVRRFEALPQDARLALVVAAAEPVGDPVLLLRAAGTLGIPVTAADIEANSDGLLSVGVRVVFRHPCARTAVYRTARVEERRAAHAALAQVTDREAEPDRRAWHLAAAAAGADEEVAAELERSAGRAQARGGVGAAAAFLVRATELTGDPRRRTERTLAAAQASLQGGAFAVALELVERAGVLDERQQAAAALLRGQIAFASGLGGDATQLLLDAANRLEPFDLPLARETYLRAWGAAAYVGARILADISAAALALTPSQAPGPAELLLDGLALYVTEGPAAAAPTLQRVAASLPAMSDEDVRRLGWIACLASWTVWDLDGYRAIAARQVRLARNAGALDELQRYLNTLATATVWRGEFTHVASLLAELDAVSAAIGRQVAKTFELRLWALQGREAATREAVRSMIANAAPGWRESEAHWARWSSAVLDNGLARYADAASAARQIVSDPRDPFSAMWVLPELVEAAAHLGELDVAADALERLVRTTAPAGTDWALGIEAGCRAQLARGRDAERLYREAIERLGRAGLRPDLARAQLLYGEWLRREGRRVDARAQLRPAHEQLTALGMQGFAERARRELLATGEHVRRRIVETHGDLTAQEQQIALLARDGMSNSEIAARLFLSRHTVAYHLRKVFAKLGISSRRELAAALPSSESELAPA